MNQLLDNLQTRYPEENVKQIYGSAVGFYNKRWRIWPRLEISRVVNNEGGQSAVLHNLTVHALGFAPNHLKGFIDYTNYVRRLYDLGENRRLHNAVSLDDLLDEDMLDRVPLNHANVRFRQEILDKSLAHNPPDGTEPLFIDGSSVGVSRETLTVLLPQLSRLRKPLTDQEIDFLNAYSTCGSMAEAAAFVGKTRQWGHGVIRKLKLAVTLRL